MEKNTKNNFKRNLILGTLIFFGFIFVFSAALLSYSNGQKLDRYILSAKSMHDTTKNWPNDFSNDEKLESKKNKLVNIKNISKRYQEDLEKTSPPKGAEEIHNSLSEYFQLSNKISSDALNIIEYGIIISETSDQVSTFSVLNNTSNEKVLESLKLAKTNIKNSQAKLKAIEVPKNFKESHKYYVEALVKLDLMYDKIIDAISNNKTEELILISTELASVSETLSSVPDPLEVIEKEFEPDLSRLIELEKIIEGDLQNK